METNQKAYQTNSSIYSYGADCPDIAMANSGYEYQFTSQSHTGKLRLEVDVEPIDFEMSLDIEKQAALSAQRERDKRRIREDRYRFYEGQEGRQTPPVGCLEDPRTPLGAPIPQYTHRDSENSELIRIEEQCGTNDCASEMEMEMNFRPCTDEEDEPCESAHSYTHVHMGNRILALRIPYLGPVGWTVPARDGTQVTRPFLIYQDPTAGFLSPALPAVARKPINEHVHLLASDDKENVTEGIAEDQEGDLPDRDAYVQDNMVAEAENIVELAAMNDGWNIRSLRDRPHHLDLEHGEYGYGYADNDLGHGLYRQYGHGDVFQQHQYNQERDHQPEMEFNVAVGGSLEASPVRSQRAHSNSIVIVSPQRRTSRLNEAGNDGHARWGGSPRAPSGFF